MHIWDEWKFSLDRTTLYSIVYDAINLNFIFFNVVKFLPLLCILLLG